MAWAKKDKKEKETPETPTEGENIINDNKDIKIEEK
mgnify:CR=1 FL=1